jgi:tetratricopeptide (TPR) repeat protein
LSVAVKEQAKLGARIRKLRMERGLSQEAIAQPLLSGAYLSLIESGQRTPSQDVLTHIASKLGVGMVELVTGKPTGLDAELELQVQQARSDIHHGELDAVETALRTALAQSRRFGLGRIAAKAGTVLGSLLEKRGDLQAAYEAYEEASGFLADEPVHMRFETVIGLARCTRFLGDPRLGVHLLESYRVELEQSKMEDPTAKMRVHAALVHFYRAIGYESRAVEAAEEAIRLSPEVDDPEQVACMSMNVARVLLDQGKHDDAVEMLRRAEHIYQSFDWPLPLVRAKTNRGIVLLDKERLDDAHDSFSEAVAILGEFPQEKLELAATLNLLGKTERLRGNVEVAEGHLKRARRLLPKEEVFERAMNSLELGLAVAIRDPKLAQRELQNAADTYAAAGANQEAARAMLELGRIVLRSGDESRAARILEEGLARVASSSST